MSISQKTSKARIGAPHELTEKQLAYAANDVAYLHRLKEALDAMLAREGRTDLAHACFRFLPARAELDLAGWAGGRHFRPLTGCFRRRGLRA